MTANDLHLCQSHGARPVGAVAQLHGTAPCPLNCHRWYFYQIFCHSTIDLQLFWVIIPHYLTIKPMIHILMVCIMSASNSGPSSCKRKSQGTHRSLFLTTCILNHVLNQHPSLQRFKDSDFLYLRALCPSPETSKVPSFWSEVRGRERWLSVAIRLGSTPHSRGQNQFHLLCTRS